MVGGKVVRVVGMVGIGFGLWVCGIFGFYMCVYGCRELWVYIIKGFGGYIKEFGFYWKFIEGYKN